MSKHIYLWRQIAASDDYNSDDRRTIRETLCWLDDHADQAPGRTITESDYQKIIDETSASYGFGFTDGFHQAGGSIVPDPKPTNAELLEQLHDQYRMFPAQHLPGNGSLADYLDHKGVKAPDHD